MWAVMLPMIQEILKLQKALLIYATLFFLIYDISRERVRQIEKNILKKMKAYFKDEIPDFDSFSDGHLQ